MVRPNGDPLPQLIGNELIAIVAAVVGSVAYSVSHPRRPTGRELTYPISPAAVCRWSTVDYDRLNDSGEQWILVE